MIQWIVASLAPLMSTIILIPQVYHTYQTKHVKGLSLIMIFLLFFANVLWLIHGYFIKDLSLIVSGILQLFMVMILLIMYYFYK